MDTCAQFVSDMLPAHYIISRWVEIPILAALFTFLCLRVLKLTRLETPCRTARNQMLSAAYAILLYRRSPKSVVRHQLAMILSNVKMLICLAPMLIVCGAVFAVFWRPLSERYQCRPLGVGQEFLVRVTALNSARPMRDFDLVADAASFDLNGRARVGSQHTSWTRLQPKRAGTFAVAFAGDMPNIDLLLNIAKPECICRPFKLSREASVAVFYPRHPSLGPCEGWLVYFLACTVICWTPLAKISLSMFPSE
jgi:hypothetical protein